MRGSSMPQVYRKDDVHRRSVDDESCKGFAGFFFSSSSLRLHILRRSRARALNGVLPRTCSTLCSIEIDSFYDLSPIRRAELYILYILTGHAIFIFIFRYIFVVKRARTSFRVNWR